MTLLYTYNAQGDQEVRAVDLNQNDQIDFSGTDRISQTLSDVITSNSLTRQRTQVYRWDLNGQSQKTLIQESQRSLTTRESWAIQFGLMTHTLVISDSAGEKITTTTAPDGTFTTREEQNGNLQAVTFYDPASNQVRRTTYNYDGHGRRHRMIDARNGTTIYWYTTADQISSITAPAPTNGAATPITSYTYDERGRVSTVTDPANGVISNQYYATGQLQESSGARTYPIAYTYDNQGRLITMTTWQHYATGDEEHTTQWSYHSQRGWLTEKSDANGNDVDYSYTAAGRLARRTSARDLITSNTYNQAGQLTDIDYSDSTPSVDYFYDRVGRIQSITDASGSRDIQYNNVSQPTTIEYTDGPLTEWLLYPSYNSLHRQDFLTVEAFGTSVYSNHYQYGNDARLQSVSRDTHHMSYGYEPDSMLVKTLAHTNGTTAVNIRSQAHDFLNRITSISNSVLSVPSVVNQKYNSVNQRTNIVWGDNSLWKYTYDEGGQLQSATHNQSNGTPYAGQEYSFTHDDIGNRNQTDQNGRTSSYTVNEINQYTGRTIPNASDITGTAESDAIVTVNNQPTTRQGAYFHSEETLSNSTTAAYQPIQVVGVAPEAGTNGTDVVTTETGNLFLPQDPESFSYDADGNLTQDGRWDYTWDAENRLTEIQTRTDINTNVPQQKLEFVHDSQGRRITKKIYDWTGTWTLAQTIHFLYDDWNMIAEIDNNGNVIRSYTWGLDLSGTVDGAGGVGGLLALTDHTTTNTYYTVYDGNGNITALIDSSDSSIVAIYEYSPFGELIRQSGPYAEQNPFTFSSKYRDAETDLVYYGYRYYNPSTGRFLSKDPIEEDGGVNLYAFVNNDPVNKIDYLGLYSKKLQAEFGEVIEVSQLTRVTMRRSGEEAGVFTIDGGVDFSSDKKFSIGDTLGGRDAPYVQNSRHSMVAFISEVTHVYQKVLDKACGCPNANVGWMQYLNGKPDVGFTTHGMDWWKGEPSWILMDFPGVQAGVTRQFETTLHCTNPLPGLTPEQATKRHHFKELARIEWAQGITTPGRAVPGVVRKNVFELHIKSVEGNIKK